MPENNKPWRVFRCDDGMGFKLTILRAPDGDFHLGMERDETQPNAEETARGAGDYDALYGIRFRVRAPFVGGGDMPELYDALHRLFVATAHLARETPRG